jgi:hypothetical protein
MGTDYPFPWTKTAVDPNHTRFVAILEETAEKLRAVKLGAEEGSAR